MESPGLGLALVKLVGPPAFEVDRVGEDGLRRPDNFGCYDAGYLAVRLLADPAVDGICSGRLNEVERGCVGFIEFPALVNKGSSQGPLRV
jgi:hypothetical protein